MMLLSGNIFAECSLDTVPSPAVDSFAKNIDTLIEAIKKEAPERNARSHPNTLVISMLPYQRRV